MKFHRWASMRALLLLQLLLLAPACCEAKLGAPIPSSNEKENNDATSESPESLQSPPHTRKLGLPSCDQQHSGQFRYMTRTRGTVETSCFKLSVQVSRNAISSQHMDNKCAQRLVGLDDQFGVAATVADICPSLCGRPCGDGISSVDSTETTAAVADSNDIDMFNSDDTSIALEPIQDGPAAVDEDQEGALDEEAETETTPTVVDTPSMEEQEQEEPEAEKPRPLIASFEPIGHGEGEWGDTFDMELVPIHTILLPDGQILSYGTSAKGRQGADLYYEVWDWNNGIHGKVHKLLKHNTKADIFCSSLNVDPSNGNIIIMGGDVRDPDAGFGIETVLEYDVRTESVRKHPKGDMHYARWYGTSVNLPNGDIFVVGGRDDDKNGSPIPEVYSPQTGFRKLKRASVPAIAKEKTKNHWWYPHTYVNSKGNIIVVMPRKDNADIYRVDVEGDGSITRIGKKPFEAHVRSPSIMFRNDQVAFLDDKGGLWVADISDSSFVSWKKTTMIGHGRTNGSMAILPDGRVALIGGARSTDDGGSNLSKAERSIHIWDPETNKLTRGAKEENARLYHSSALVLPDGSLISAGGGAPGPVKNRNGQLYHPDYLYNTKQVKSSRPKIMGCPRNIQSGASFVITVDDTSRVVKVTTTKSGSSSHTRNCDSRWLDLDFDILSDTKLKVYAESRNTMIGGLWLVNVLDVYGVPSAASLMGVDMAPL